MIQKGYYKHFKGGLYEVRGISTDPDTNQKRVQYFPVGNLSLEYSKPLDDFISRKLLNGQYITRYQFISVKD